jgi:DtxR family Mn-dependent transcriptional regulator
MKQLWWLLLIQNFIGRKNRGNIMPNPLIALLIAAALSALFLWFFWPERGIFWRWQRANEMTDRVLTEDALKRIHQCEIHNSQPSIQSLAGSLNSTPNEIATILNRLEAQEYVVFEGANFRLTPGGRDYALRIIRAHRLLESYLADATGFQESEWHDRAERLEHSLSTKEIDQLSARLGNPTHDPHGDPIPTSRGEMFYVERTPLVNLEPEQFARILHIEDEPDVVYAQIVAEGLHVGQIVRMIDSSPQRVRFWAGGDEHLLAPIMAANIAVQPLPDEEDIIDDGGEPLTSLQVGEVANILTISPQTRGLERRRLMDLGILPGTPIEIEMLSPSGNPTAYRIRGAVIALRQSQAEDIRIQRQPEVDP